VRGWGELRVRLQSDEHSMTAPASLASQTTQRHLPDWLLPLICCFLASFCILIPFFRFGTASGHDFEFHAASWLDVAYQWKHGVLFPRWTEWTNHGFGEPRFIFYPPISWLLGAVLTLVLPGPAVPMAYIVLMQTLAGLSAYLLLRRLTIKRAALLGAVFYSVNPNALLMSYIRSDFAEQLACALFPLLLLSALEMCESLEDARPSRRTLVAFACLYAGAWLCNAPAGVIASYAMALLIAWAALTRRSWRILARGIGALALGLGLAGFYLVPAAYEQRWVNIAQALASGLSPADNFLFTQIDDVEHTWFNWIASICAICLILIFGMAALFSRRFSRRLSRDRNHATFLTLLIVGTAGSALMMRWTAPLWKYLPKLRFIQFPWRWMSIVALIAACFLALVCERRWGWVLVVAVLALLVPLGHFLVQNTWWDQDEMPNMQDGINDAKGFDGVDEYDPVGDDHTDLPANAALAKVLPSNADEQPPQAQVQVQHWTTKNKEIRVQTTAPARVALRVLNYPAWKVEVNGKPLSPGRMDDVNQMVVPVEAGTSNIRVIFTRTTDRKIGDAISLLSGFLAVFLLWRARPLPTSST
jgi:hypothetical protein